MNLTERKDLIIYINLFVHYPGTFNASTISNKFNIFLKEYFLENKSTYSIYNHDCDTMINDCPHSEKETLKIELVFSKNEISLHDKELLLLKIKEFVKTYFNNNIKDIDIVFSTNK